ncbi:chemotaxis protein CheB [Hyalangium minutum]|uniref:protein-glutamate methylesterase n=1 Tax=Hyalangium minutum TaxID=394096 RepID=A0A085WFT6_9BACT|nr:chemotaxis protein CheB [Hyalangium minutum]KFE66549.1 Chemotaxis response regulator protein-glutamate methylesterase CheB [Hyalangium minutum]
MARAKFKEPRTGGSATVVVGVSSGGMDALTRLVAQLPESFPAPMFVVQHMSADTTGDALVHAINKHGKLVCTHAQDGEKFVGGHIYLAPSDHHLMIGKGKILVTKGARENRSRPAIDPLFRSAAVAYGNRVIGVLLTGYLDDGTAGLTAIRRCGGTCVVQDPQDAAYPDMPQNALNRVKVDYCLPLAEMGALLSKLVQRKFGGRKPVPRDIAIEAKIAERVLSDVRSVDALGKQVPFNCPGCGGVLWKVEKDKSLRYRCHTGHAYTAPVLLAEQTAKVEETLWVALRMFEERRNLLLSMHTSLDGPGYRSASERAKESEVHIKRIRAILNSGDKATDDDVSEH